MGQFDLDSPYQLLGNPVNRYWLPMEPPAIRAMGVLYWMYQIVLSRSW